MSVPHSAMADVKVRNYVIPKGAVVLPSLFHVMYNPDYFKEPEVFNPDRLVLSFLTGGILITFEKKTLIDLLETANGLLNLFKKKNQLAA